MSFNEQLILLCISGVWWLIFFYRNPIYKIIQKIILKFFPSSFNVAFSVESNSGLNSWVYFKEFIDKFEKIIWDENLENVIKINNFSDIYKFKSNKEAEKFRNKKWIDLIVWWKFSNDTLRKNWKKINDLKLKYTCFILQDSNWNIGKLVQHDISTKLQEKNKWTINDDNSYSDVEIVWNNLFDMALYILSISLRMQWDFFKSTELLERHLNNLFKRKDPFSKHIQNHLIWNYKAFIINSILSSNKYNKKVKYKEWKEYCNKILQFYPKNYFALTNLAFFEYSLWNRYEATQLIEKIKEYYSKNPSSIINIAFLYLIDEKYKESYKWYSKLYNVWIEQLDFNPIETLNFLSIEYTNNKNPGILFASGYISYLYWDKTLAKKDLQKFLKLIDKSKAKNMFHKADKLVQNLS